ncbi:MAG: rRNA maturation RNase YbeY [Blastocatellia bacterium]
MAIEVVNRQRLARVDRRRFARLASETLAALDKAGAGVTLAFVRDDEIRSLNRTFRGKDSATDVLSFPFSDQPADDPVAEDVNLGDVVISADTARRQASEGGHSFEREVSELIIHGILHLCGYDHERDAGEMNRLELSLRRELLDKD